ncbi:AzlD domain-containing protein [Vibrio salinus]|uniref:AzlD domain-containing protein n=1 Tax=Vibrio salinus TaxID=2899784 RepID=UPI001E5A0A22|nr:AzlD domain-containing protein [Vibrio salinus]MCE0495846.1 AzlD domain-containing protein [Vibrio salinus]
MNQHIITGIALLAVGTYLFRLAGPVLGRRFHFPETIKAITSELSTVLLFSVAVISTIFDGNLYAGHAHVAGVLIAAVFAYRKMPFLIIVLSAAFITAILRALGIE